MDVGQESNGEGVNLAEASRRVTLFVNGTARSVRSTTTLLSALRDELGLTGAKPGCGEGACGSCTVLVDGETVKACQQEVEDIAGRSVTTIEGLASAAALHHVQQAFVEIGAAQCGYCTPAMVLAVVALLQRDPDPIDAAIDDALAGNICRCGCYPQIRRAVRRAVELVAKPAVELKMAVGPSLDRWGIPDPRSPARRPARPWDMTEPEDCDWFEILGDGLVVVLRPPPLEPGSWTTGGGAWLHASPDGTVTAFTGKVDVGQDNCTALRSWSQRSLVSRWRGFAWRWATPICAPTTWAPSVVGPCPTPVAPCVWWRPSRERCCPWPPGRAASRSSPASRS